MKIKVFRRVITLGLVLLFIAFMALAGLQFYAPVAEDGNDNSALSNAPATVVVLHDNAEKNSITLKENDKETLNALVNLDESYSKNWQILTPDTNKWVNIAGKTQDSLSVTYSLIGSMLDSRDRAYLRLAVQSESGFFVSEPVEILLSRFVDEPTMYENTQAVYGLKRSATPLAEDEELQTFTIVINYIFDNGGIAFEPYGASVAKGSNFNRSVESPTVVGYDPFIRSGEDYIDASVVELNYENIQENKTVNVIYRPAIVDYQVHHHLQNLVGDDYSLTYDYITYGKGLTGAIVPEGLAKTEEELPGFKALAYEKLEIAADGSTVIEIRYDRNYYLIDFDMNGGFGTEPVYTRYGAEVGANDPIRHGYLFDGWELVSYGGKTPTPTQASMYDINATNQITVPNASLTYKARWITQLTTYTMVFWRENADNNGFSFWGDLDGISAMSGSVVSGADRVNEAGDLDDTAYFTYAPSLTDKNVIVEGDGSTIVNVYYTRNRYTITFKAPGLCTIEEGHTHDDSCYTAICGEEHIHDESCIPTLVCKLPEHAVHTEECIVCGKTEHEHGDSCCNLTEHTHTTSCWSGVGTAQTATGAPNNPVDGQIYYYRWMRRYYIYIKGTWYRYTGSNVSSGDVVMTNCGYTEHIHGDANCSCLQAEHTHIDSCYRDTLHTHGEDCYNYSCGAKEHTHTDDCFVLDCDKPTGHTHTNNCNNASRTNTVLQVRKKYQQTIGDIWPITDGNGVCYDDGQRWKPSESSTYSNVLVYISNMPGEDFTLTLDTTNNDAYTMHYYMEVLDGDPYDKEYNGKYFLLQNTIVARYNYITQEEDFFEIPGFYRFASNPAFSGNQIDINGGGDVSFYYGRITENKLEFRSNGQILIDKTVTGQPYGAPLTSYEFTPDYPASLEPNAFFFDGWYTTPEHYAGTEVDWATATVQEGDITYYAKWSPILHEVKVFLTADLTEQIGETQTVPHNNLATPPSEIISNGNYTFQGWFYTDTVDGVTTEKAFVFTGIRVLKDLNIYAKWSSHVSVKYKINFVLYTTKEPIADSLEGTAIAGHNKTFYAKAGADLYAGFETGHYPLTNSHTVTMSAESDHEFTFEYVYVESMPYIVKYLDQNGNKVAEDKVVTDNNLSVVTETFVRADQMMPDAYQKRLVLVATGTDSDGDEIWDENTIIFRYNSDAIHAYYKVVHYIESIDTDAYREYRSEENVGEIGKEYTVSALTLTGFTLKSALTKVDGVAVTPVNGEVIVTLDDDGLLIELYYDRDDVNYFVNYLENETGKVLRAQKRGAGIFGEQVVEYAVGLTHEGYSLVSEEVKALSLSSNPEHNIINFYYQEAVYAIRYQIVGLDGCGSLTHTSENIKAVSGVAEGSAPIVQNGYHFVGWFLDENCLKPVDPAWVNSDNQLVPQKEGVWNANLVFYAKIDPNFTTFTINTLGATALDSDQVFFFRIRGTSTETQGVDITVAVVGNSSVTISGLQIGTYTVTELNDWSFRYQPDSVIKAVELGVDTTKNTVTFSHVKVMDKWLDGNGNAK